MEDVAPSAQAGTNAMTTTREEFERRVALLTKELLEIFSLDPYSDGLRDTPARVGRSWWELLEGYRQDPAKILKRTFPSEKNDEMVLLRNIHFYSTCEHHLLPFSGVAHIGYLPANGRIVGISKLARVVDCFARRLQIQERMTSQIADAIELHLKPFGVGVVVEATHLCMVCRGVTKSGSIMTTSALRGNFKSQADTRAEFLGLTRRQ